MMMQNMMQIMMLNSGVPLNQGNRITPLPIHRFTNDKFKNGMNNTIPKNINNESYSSNDIKNK